MPEEVAKLASADVTVANAARIWDYYLGGSGSSEADREVARLVLRAAPYVPLAALAGIWPYRTFLELGALPSAVPCARLHTRQVLWEWGLADCSETTELLVTELTTNAMQASRALMQDDPIKLWLVSNKMQIVVLVWDASPLPPVPMDTGDDAENGRGLLLVQAVSTRWGWHFPPDIGGKVVWAQTLAE